MTEVRYLLAAPSECGLLRAHDTLSYCRMKKGHRSVRHSTKTHRHDPAGFDWISEESDGMEWPQEGLELLCPKCGSGVDVEEYEAPYDEETYYRIRCSFSKCAMSWSRYGDVEDLPKPMR